ncbi:MAG: sensor histidine kinase, partial [Nocardioidaceae bacterium]
MQPPSPDAYQPRLTRWTHTWRLLAAIAISALAWSSVWTHQWQQTRMLFWVDLGLGLAGVPLVLVRRRYPLAVPVVLAVMSSVSASAIGPGVLAGVSLATRRRLPQILLVGVVSVLSGALFSATQQNYLPTPLWAQVIVSVAVTVATLAIGMYVGSRRELLWTLQDRAERAEDEQELRVREARSK